MLLPQYLFCFFCPLISSLTKDVLDCSDDSFWEIFSSFDFIFWIQCWRPCLPRMTRVVARLRPRTEKRRRVVTDLRDRMLRASLRLDGLCPALPPAGQLWCEPHVFWRQAGVWTIGIFLSLAPPAMRDELLTSHPSVFPRDDVPAVLSQRYHSGWQWGEKWTSCEHCADCSLWWQQDLVSAKISAHTQNILNYFALFNWQHRIKEIGGEGYRELTAETLTN